MPQPKIAIIGGGLCGSLLAWRLSRNHSHKVTVYERRAQTSPLCASYVAAGMLAPYSEAADKDAQIITIAHDGIARWRDWLKLLCDDLAQLDIKTKPNDLLSARGSIIVAHPDDMHELVDFEKKLRACVPDTLASQFIDQSGISALEPELQNFTRGIFIAEEGHLDNRLLLSALYQSSIATDCLWHWNTDFNTATMADDLSLWARENNYDYLFDCRGAAAIADYKHLRAIRGEIVRVYAPHVHLSRPVRLLHPRYALYVVPQPKSIYAVGATEIESDYQGQVTVRSALELLSALHTVHAGFDEAEIVALEMSLRCVSVDAMPYVAKLAANVICINGMYRHGYLLAPRFVEQAMLLMND